MVLAAFSCCLSMIFVVCLYGNKSRRKLVHCVSWQSMNSFLYNDFIFSSRYRVWRHIIYWSFHIIIWAAFWVVMGLGIPYERQLLYLTIWTPGFILFSYPVIYGAIPYLLLKGKVLQFFLAMLGWGAAGLYIDEAYRRIHEPYFFLLDVDRKLGIL